MEMTVAPPFMQSFWILNFTIAAMPARLPARISRLGRLLPIGRIMISATIHMPVITRNMRSFRLILWSKIVSIHFFNTWFSSCLYCNVAMHAQTSSYRERSAG